MDDGCLAQYSPASLERKFCECEGRPRATLLPLNPYGSPVDQNFGDALHHLGGIVANTNHGVRAQHLGMLKHLVERILTSPFAQISE